MRKEIEVKAKVDDLENIVKKLQEKGCVISEPITQKDSVYISPEVSYEDMKFGDNFLRVRETKNRSYFTLKQMQANELDNIEEETEISDPEAMKKSLEILGYTLAVRVNKTRRKTNLDGLEICLDEVENLGQFIEVEKITDDSEDAEKVQEKLFYFLSQFGTSKEDRVKQGYDTLIYFKNKS